MTDVGLVALGCGLLGLLFGSFANVVIHRVPAGESLSSPPSTCPSCGNRIKPYDNIPVVSWLVLRGTCRHCEQRISPMYPLVELTMGLIFAGVGARIGPDWTLPGFLLFVWLLVVVAVIDARTRKIPNRLTYPLTPALLVLMVVAAFLNGDPDRALAALLGGLGGFIGLLLLALIQPKGMGMGDVKLAGFIGIGLGYLGWPHVVLGLFGGFLLGGVAAIALLLLRSRGRRDLIPFGPYLSAGGILTLLIGEPIIAAYLRSLGL